MREEISELTVGATLDEWTDLIKAALVGMQGIVDMDSHSTKETRQRALKSTDAVVRRILDKAGRLHCCEAELARKGQ